MHKQNESFRILFLSAAALPAWKRAQRTVILFSALAHFRDQTALFQWARIQSRLSSACALQGDGPFPADEVMMMKKCSSFILVLILLFSRAHALTITAMATEPYMETFALYASYARILGYDSRSCTLDVELIAPEIFSRDDVESLRAGDSIYTAGHAFRIASVAHENSEIILSGDGSPGSEGAVRLKKDFAGNYRPVSHGDWIWNTMARLSLPVTRNLLFLDGPDPAAGDISDRPDVYSADAFLSVMEGEAAGTRTGPGFSCNNVMVVFDQDAQLSVIERFHTPLP